MPENWFEPQPFGKYLLTERIGAGGMAEIFRATAFGVEGFTKEVCIKRILPTLTNDETFVKMFVDEAKIAVTLHHANIVQVFDLGRIGEHYFIAMELVRGRDLLQIINRLRSLKRRMPVPVALGIISEVCEGLDYAHRVKVEGRPLGLIHRDVSPSNILVSWNGEVKVGDFGIAKAAAIKDEKTATGTMKGKYGYMAPEQVKGEHIDQRSDIFAVGILLYESLVGNRLFKGETDLETLEKVKVATVAPRPSEVNKKVTPEVERIILRALALNPEDRFQSAGELREALLDRLGALGVRFDKKALAEYIQKLFAEEIQAEEEHDKKWRMIGPPPQGAGTGPQSGDPPTRRDLPPGAVTIPPPSSSNTLVIAAWVSGVVLVLAVGLLVTFWLLASNRSLEPVPPPNPPPIERPELPKPGTLSVISQPPGAAVALDGQPTGQVTPARFADLDRAKSHTLRLTLEGFEPWDKTVLFEEAQTVALEAQLDELPKIKPPPPKPPPPAPVVGTLNINAVPVWAYVTIDGSKQAQPTPLYGLKLRPGVHTVRLENPKLGWSKTEQVTIKKGETVDLVVKLK